MIAAPTLPSQQPKKYKGSPKRAPLLQNRRSLSYDHCCLSRDHCCLSHKRRCCTTAACSTNVTATTSAARCATSATAKSTIHRCDMPGIRANPSTLIAQSTNALVTPAQWFQAFPSIGMAQMSHCNPPCKKTAFPILEPRRPSQRTPFSPAWHGPSPLLRW